MCQLPSLLGAHPWSKTCSVLCLSQNMTYSEVQHGPWGRRRTMGWTVGRIWWLSLAGTLGSPHKSPNPCTVGIHHL